jgi:hypothetical protein
MTDDLTFFMDESGFTGEDLLSADQPVFAHASTTASADLCRELYIEFFRGTQAPELKHSKLAGRPRGRDRIVKFLKTLHDDHRDLFTCYIIHKEFCLLTFLVDRWVEWAMYLDGYDLYRDGGALAFSNLSFFSLRTFQSDDFLRRHLVRFQNMMRQRTLLAYQDFWGAMYADYRRVDPRTQEILSMFLFSERRLGYPHLLRAPPRSIDVAIPSAVQSCVHWRRGHKRPLVLIHDRSSYLAKDQDLWDLITSPNVDEMVVGIPGRDMELPLNVRRTVFEESKDHLQLQFCDLLAGAMAHFGGSVIAEAATDDYRKRLEDLGIEKFLIGSIWPELKVTPEELGTRGASGEFVERLTEQLRRLDTSGTLVRRGRR